MFFFVAKLLYSFNFYVSPKLLAGVIFGFFFLLHLYGTWQSGRPKITHIEATLPDLPEAWRGKNIVFLSDLHLERYARKNSRRK